MLTCDTTQEESDQRRWCQNGVQCLSFYRVTHLCENVLTQMNIMVPTLYLIIEMLTQRSKLALICMGLQSRE